MTDDIFQARVLVAILDVAAYQPKATDVRNLLNVFDVQDVGKNVHGSLVIAFTDLHNGHLVRAQAGLIQAFWAHYCANEDYSGHARCFVNPPKGFSASGDSHVTVSTHDHCGQIGQTISLVDPLNQVRNDLILNGVEGEEKGFFNEVVIFCSGLLDKAKAAELAKLIGPHILPETTAILFEMPNNDNIWLKLFDAEPNDDVANFLSALTTLMGFSLEKIDLKNNGPRTTVFFGVRA